MIILKFDMLLVVMGVGILIASSSAIALFFIGVPDGVQVGKNVFLIGGAFGIVLALAVFKWSIKKEPSNLELLKLHEERGEANATASKPKLTPSLKKHTPPEQVVISPTTVYKSAEDIRAQELRNAFDEAFQTDQNIAVLGKEEEEADPPEYDKYFDDSKASVEGALEARKKAYYSQVEQPNTPEVRSRLTSDSLRAHTQSPSSGIGTKPIPAANLNSPDPLVPFLQHDRVKTKPGISSITYTSAQSGRSDEKGEPVSLAGASYYFEDLPELKYFRTSVFKPKLVEYKSTPGDPNSKAHMKLFGMNLKVTAKPKMGSFGASESSESGGRGSILKDSPDQSSGRLRLDELRRKFHGK